MSKINLDTEIEECKDELKDALKTYRKMVDVIERRSQIPVLASFQSKLHAGSTGYGIDTEYYREMVYKNRPYSFFVTLTFRRNVTFHQMCQYCSTLIHRYANLEFGRNYCFPDCITGFAFFEKHSDNLRSNENHLHLLIKHHEVFDDESDFREHLLKFHKASSKIMGNYSAPCSFTFINSGNFP